MAEQHPIEISAPDISAYRDGNTGVDYVHIIESGQPGPTAMVQALTHGNELCGAIALDYLFRSGLKPTRGSLILAFANVGAFERFDIADPNRSRFVDEDYNRVWSDETIDGPRDTAELRRARQLRPFVERADFLLDIHSMHEPCRPIMVCGMIQKGIDFARRVGVPEDLMVDTGHPAGRRMRDRGGFDDPDSPKAALLIECGQHWEKASVDVAIDTLMRFLVAAGVNTEHEVSAHLRITPPARQRVVRVTEPIVAKSMDFHFLVPYSGLQVIEKAGTPIAADGDKVWAAPYDGAVMVMPSMAHVAPGNTMVRFGRYDD